MKEILPLNIDYLAYPAYTAGDKEALQAYLEAVRKQGKKAKAVLPDCAADDPHVVNLRLQVSLHCGRIRMRYRPIRAQSIAVGSQGSWQGCPLTGAAPIMSFRKWWMRSCLQMRGQKWTLANW